MGIIWHNLWFGNESCVWKGAGSKEKWKGNREKNKKGAMMEKAREQGEKGEEVKGVESKDPPGPPP